MAEYAIGQDGQLYRRGTGGGWELAPPDQQARVAQTHAGASAIPAQLPPAPAPEIPPDRPEDTTPINWPRVARMVPHEVFRGIYSVPDLAVGAGRAANAAISPGESMGEAFGSAFSEEDVGGMRGLAREQEARRRAQYEADFGEPYPDLASLPGREQAVTAFGAGGLEALLTGGPKGGGLARSVAERRIAPALAEFVAGGSGAAAAQGAPEEFGPVGTTLAAMSGGLAGASAVGAAGGLSTAAKSRLLPAARRRALEEEAGYRLSTILGGEAGRERNVARIREVSALEASGAAPGRAPLAGTLEDLSPTARPWEVSLGTQSEDLRGALANLRRTNEGEYDRLMGTVYGGDPSAHVAGFERAGIRDPGNIPTRQPVIRSEVSQVYRSFEDHPGATMIGVQTGPVKNAAAEARVMASRGRGAGEQLLPRDVLDLVDKMPESDDLLSLEAVRKRVNAELERADNETTRLYLRRIKGALDTAEKDAIAKGDEMVSAMSMYGGRADPAFEQRMRQQSEALALVKQARASRAEAGRLLDDTKNVARVERLAPDHDAIMGQLIKAPVNETETYVDTLRRLPDKAERDQAFDGLVRSFVRNFEPAASGQSGRTITSIADMTPHQAKKLAQELRDPQNMDLRPKALAILGAKNPRNAQDELERFAKLIERVPALFGGEIDTGKVRVTTGQSLPGATLQGATEAFMEGREGMKRKVRDYLRDRVGSEAEVRKIVEDAFVDKELAAMLLENVNPQRFAGWKARVERKIVMRGLVGVAMPTSRGVRGAVLQGEQQ